MRLPLIIALCALPISASALETQRGDVDVVAVATDLEQPWGVAALPDGTLLVTERDGRLIRIAEGRNSRVVGTPRVAARGQGGLLDMGK